MTSTARNVRARPVLADASRIVVKIGSALLVDAESSTLNRARLEKLADEKINVTAADAVAAGKGRYGMILWVRPKDYARAARVLRAK